ncbi:scaffold protein Scd2 [Byssothecium circinans]|uniref:Scaffold protein Scd2 n=1 Tax=Byssothecium circinans TaxID=147558 RepID=A0A6A5U6N9_9PLEO|nr:scaffold protein Scd2 [Byssothecium circinans]
MMKFRRSMKSEKDSRPHHISIPPKDAIAIVPPKKVIKALYDYTHSTPDPGYLSFSQGDFLHVVGRENDTDWYEACNPLHGTRGLVPVTYFEPVGKTVRDSAGSHGSAPTNAPHDSGYQERSVISPAGTDGGMRTAGRASAQAGMGGPGAMAGMAGMANMAAMMGKGSGAMVYGIVIYDFKAERPDELEAKEGEAIIVIAQSNPEWFVAKPITRLGGPGLIPVSFIEIRDMTTGKAATDPQEAVRRAGVPKVEEWKKMAADYKNGSIPLGKLEANSQQTLQQGMERMSLSSKSPAGGTSNGSYGQAPSVTSHTRATSMAQRPQYESSDSNLLAPIKASVPRYCFADDIFWFIIECEMSDGRYWELQRLYQDFYDLQIQLIATYPIEAGTNGGERTLPFMPGPVTYVTDNISNGRRANLDEYIQNLLILGSHITNGYLVKKFFAPRQGDYEIEPDAFAQEGYRLSGQSGHSSNPSQGTSRQSSADQLQATTPQTPYSTGSNFPGHQRGPSYGGLNPPPMQHQHTGLSATSAVSSNAGSPLKIKVWFEEDNCVVIRMPPSMRYADLYAKLRERREMEKPEERNEELYVEYRDEVEAKYYPIENDEDLQIAVERNPKLNLSVSVAR